MVFTLKKKKKLQRSSILGKYINENDPDKVWPFELLIWGNKNSRVIIINGI